MRIVLDTNVLVSGLLNPYGAPGRMVDLILGGKVQVLYDDRILAEYLDVLAHPQLAIDVSLAQAVIGYIRLSGERVITTPLPDDSLPDPDDVPFLEIAISGRAEAIITGNAKHFPASKVRGANVMAPAQFLEMISS